MVFGFCFSASQYLSIVTQNLAQLIYLNQFIYLYLDKVAETPTRTQLFCRITLIALIALLVLSCMIGRIGRSLYTANDIPSAKTQEVLIRTFKLVCARTVECNQGDSDVT